MPDTLQSTSKPKLELEYLKGPHGRWYEFKFVFLVFKDFIRGLRKLHFLGPCITVFGSARFKEDHEYYVLAREMGKRIAEYGFGVVTGGGPGIMEAANRGAKDVNGKSIGINVELPFEQHPNPYLDKMVLIKHFFVRKVFLLKYSFGFVIMPGGFGTLDEMYETMTLIQTKKIPWFPIVLMGKSYWKDTIEQMEVMDYHKTISPEDDEMLLVTDDPEEAMNFLTDRIDKYSPKWPKIKPKWWLGEEKLD
ncbi:MAG: TIGR00730 family Rossman fold protein [Bacteroidia bacterium]|nr:TIGR00730 family Rossman fold protein [Bacteroidia bacterium]